LDSNCWKPTWFQTTPNTFPKTSSDGNWDGRVYSQEAYDHAYMSWQTDSTSGYAMAALTADPTASTSYSTLDYAWYYADGGSLAIFENGSSIGTFGSYTTSTITTIEYDGSTVKYYKTGFYKEVVQQLTEQIHFISLLQLTRQVKLGVLYLVLWVLKVLKELKVFKVLLRPMQILL
jgi:hypothetical protein